MHIIFRGDFMTHPIGQANYINTLILTLCPEYNEGSCVGSSRENKEEEKGGKGWKQELDSVGNRLSYPLWNPHIFQPPYLNCLDFIPTIQKKNPAYRTHRISRPMRIVGPIQFWRGCVTYLEKRRKKKKRQILEFLFVF